MRKLVFFGLTFVTGVMGGGWKGLYLCSQWLPKSLIQEQLLLGIFPVPALHRLLDAVSKANTEQHHSFQRCVPAFVPACCLSARPHTASHSRLCVAALGWFTLLTVLGITRLLLTLPFKQHCWGAPARLCTAWETRNVSWGLLKAQRGTGHKCLHLKTVTLGYCWVAFKFKLRLSCLI